MTRHLLPLDDDDLDVRDRVEVRGAQEVLGCERADAEAGRREPFAYEGGGWEVGRCRPQEEGATRV